ncbi:MAG: hypothetical protein SGPRY_004631, partial [Prymnesium sp.]
LVLRYSALAMAEFEVEAIVGERQGARSSEFCIKWKGWGEECNTWEPEKSLTNCSLVLKRWRKLQAKLKDEKSAKQSPCTPQVKKKREKGEKSSPGSTAASAARKSERLASPALPDEPALISQRKPKRQAAAAASSAVTEALKKADAPTPRSWMIEPGKKTKSRTKATAPEEDAATAEAPTKALSKRKGKRKLAAAEEHPEDGEGPAPAGLQTVAAPAPAMSTPNRKAAKRDSLPSRSAGAKASASTTSHAVQSASRDRAAPRSESKSAAAPASPKPAAFKSLAKPKAEVKKQERKSIDLSETRASLSTSHSTTQPAKSRGNKGEPKVVDATAQAVSEADALMQAEATTSDGALNTEMIWATQSDGTGTLSVIYDGPPACVKKGCQGAGRPVGSDELDEGESRFVLECATCGTCWQSMWWHEHLQNKLKRA